MTDKVENDTDIENLLRAGLSDLESERYEAAFERFQQALLLDQNHPFALAGLGTALERLGNLTDAAAAYRKALEGDPKLFAAAHHLGRLLLDRGEPTTAASYLTQALEINPASTAARCDLGAAYMALDEFPRAEECFRNALALSPNFRPALINLGNCLREQLRLEEAAATFESALTANPRDIDATTKLASTLSDLKQTDRALSLLNQLLQVHKDQVECHQNKALILLRSGHLEQGFTEYEWRLYPTPIGVPSRPFLKPAWSGGDLNDKTLLIWLEQGIGDEILSLGVWDTRLKSNDAHQYMVECDPRLTPLLQRSFPKATIVSRQDPPAPETKTTDMANASWSGARFLRNDLSKFPKRKHYLVADPAKTSLLRDKYTSLAQGRKIVGLSWGSGAHKGRLKTPPLEAWQPLIADQSLFLISLQYAPSDSDIATLSKLAGQPIYVDSTVDTTADLDGSAAQISALDAVVTISNSTAHLCGALGIPVASVIPSGYGGFWYWFRDRNDSPWYPSMRIYRQKSPGDWHSAIEPTCTWLSELG